MTVGETRSPVGSRELSGGQRMCAQHRHSIQEESIPKKEGALHPADTVNCCAPQYALASLPAVPGCTESAPNTRWSNGMAPEPDIPLIADEQIRIWMHDSVSQTHHAQVFVEVGGASGARRALLLVDHVLVEGDEEGLHHLHYLHRDVQRDGHKGDCSAGCGRA